MEFEVGQKWKDQHGDVREILAAGERAVAYRWSREASIYACTPEEFRARATNAGWELVRPKPVPEGWKEEHGTLRLMDHCGATIGVRRQEFSGDGSLVGVMSGAGGTWVDPESLKAAIDYVMSDD